MRKLSTFNFVSIDGYFKGPAGDISWSHRDQDENKYAEEGVQADTLLLFGRTTYEMMASYWPSPMALQQNKVVAEGMNRSEKIVFSKTLKKADWTNTRIVKDNLVDEVRKIKQTPGKDMTILGSGSIITQLTDPDLIDEYQLMIMPVVLGEGTSLFKDIKPYLNMKLVNSRIFDSGSVLLTYKPF